MSASQYDAIVVGARCAGAPTAMLLAAQGLPGAGGRSGVVPERHPLDARDPRAGRRRAEPLGPARPGDRHAAARRSTPTRSTSGRSRSPGRPGPATASRRRTRRGGPCSTRSSSTPPSDAGAEVRERFTVEDDRHRGRRGRRHPRPRRGRADRVRARPRRDRRRRSQLACRQGRPAGRSTTRSRCCSGATTRTGAVFRSTASRSSIRPDRGLAPRSRRTTG